MKSQLSKADTDSVSTLVARAMLATPNGSGPTRAHQASAAQTHAASAVNANSGHTPTGTQASASGTPPTSVEISKLFVLPRVDHSRLIKDGVLLGGHTMRRQEKDGSRAIAARVSARQRATGVRANHQTSFRTGYVPSRWSRIWSRPWGLRAPYLSRNAKPFFQTEAATIQESGVYLACKRFMDLAGSVGMLIALAPVMAVVALAVKASSPGPVIYRQRRLTKGGQIFTIYKFRTMSAQAENKSGPVFAAANDPRVTPLGKFLRKTRLDELPQLLNVIVGDMSLIGPRPERPELAEQLGNSIPRFSARLRTKAGLTGLAQVKQGYPDGVDGYRRKLALDILYIRKQSLFLDLWIAIRTVGVIFSGSGAR